MDDDVRPSPGEEAIPRRGVGHVGLEQFDAGVEAVGWRVVRVDLGVQVVEGDDPAERVGQARGDRRTDEARAAGDDRETPGGQ